MLLTSMFVLNDEYISNEDDSEYPDNNPITGVK